MSNEIEQTTDLTYTLSSNSSYSVNGGTWSFNLQAKIPTGNYTFFDAYNISKPNQNAILIYMGDPNDDSPLNWTGGHVPVTVPTIRFYSATPLNPALLKTLIILLHEYPGTNADRTKLYNNLGYLYNRASSGPFGVYLDQLKNIDPEFIDLPKRAGMTLINRSFT